uniref:Uncharacterized protein n=1 Tax=viral metagenome TaxID=1070528 RepID=A0A6M3M6H5_9ZZZZ
MTLKTRISGRVTEVEWEHSTKGRLQINANIQIKLGTTKDQDKAEKQLQQLRKRILRKKVVIFPEE